ncbi:DUF503 domain-containing protein [Synergistaceae bacterium OttesenSCG-928-I11]|nr:DUF503 domain-containing protein [Synergistaceae bacterium OttesenSCG-928-I11]
MKLWIGVVMFSIRIYGAGSLKDRRQVVRSVLDRMKSHFNASVADLGPDNTWDKADLAVSCIGSSAQEMETRVDHICSLLSRLEDDGEFEPLQVAREVFAYGDL